MLGRPAAAKRPTTGTQRTASIAVQPTKLVPGLLGFSRERRLTTPMGDQLDRLCAGVIHTLPS